MVARQVVALTALIYRYILANLELHMRVMAIIGLHHLLLLLTNRMLAGTSIGTLVPVVVEERKLLVQILLLALLVMVTVDNL
ncbi:MAG: hypothetical protein CL557_13125 [Alphaproteobacteria bacterium]|nr:hypothetical protein [Alphaproteobacteria bacterium]MAS48336.1 hypothetical protein [Alphaproteobacteria bacterium]